MSDYTKQLDEIVRALSRQTTPVWVPVLIASILSFTAAVLLQPVLQWTGDSFKRQRMRRVLYVELVELFSTVEEILDYSHISHIEEASRWEWQREELKRLQLNGEKYLRANQDVYMQLREHMTADIIYTYFHEALDDVDHLVEYQLE